MITLKSGSAGELAVAHESKQQDCGSNPCRADEDGNHGRWNNDPPGSNSKHQLMVHLRRGETAPVEDKGNDPAKRERSESNGRDPKLARIDRVNELTEDHGDRWVGVRRKRGGGE